MRVYRALLDGCGLLAGLIIAMIAMLVSIDVLARNLGWFNLPWVLEVAEYGLYAATFLGAPWVLHHNGHVRVDVLCNSLPIGLQRVLEMLLNGIGLAVSAVLLYYGLLATLDAHSLGSLIFKELIVPEWYLLWIIPFTGVLLVLEFGLRLLKQSGQTRGQQIVHPTDA